MRQIRRGALIVAAVCAGMSAVVAVQYQTTFQGSIDASGLRALTENPAIRILFGPACRTRRRGGIHRVAHRAAGPCALECLGPACGHPHHSRRRGRRSFRSAACRTGCVWSTWCCARRQHWSWLLSLIAVGIGAALVAAGTDATGAVVYAAAVLGVTTTFASGRHIRGADHADEVGGGRRHRGLARYLARGADARGRRASTGLVGVDNPVRAHRPGRAVRRQPGRPASSSWQAWQSGSRWPVLVAAGRRDVGGGLVALPTRRTPRTGLLGSVLGFAVRRAIRPTVGWAIGIAAYYLLLGALIASILEFFDSNRRFADLAASAGFGGLNSANGFAAALFALLSIATGLYAATRLAAMVADERARRWTPVLSGSGTAKPLGMQ